MPETAHTPLATANPNDLPAWCVHAARFALLVTVAGLGMAVGVQRFAFDDGSNFFLQNLVQQHISDWDPWRQFAHYLTQGPFGLAMAAGVRSVPLLATLNGAGLFAMPLSFTRIKPVLLSTRGTSSSTAAPQDTPPALLLGFGNSLAHVVPLRQNAGIVTLPDNSRASSELAGAQHMRRRGARRPSDYGI